MGKWDIHTTKLKVNEIYKSFQGEGINSGCDCIFLRLSTCNLHCSWCDTPYTWDWKKYDFNKETKVMTIPEVAHKIRMFKIRHLVITGGEPMLQQNQLFLLLNELNTIDRKYYVEIETNGTVIPEADFVSLIGNFNISPKTSNSGNNTEALYGIYKHTLPEYNHYSNVTFKFVINTLEDVVEIEEKFMSLIDRKKIMLMPEGRTSQEIQNKDGWIYEYCMAKGYKFSTRLHILKYGNQRGV